MGRTLGLKWGELHPKAHAARKLTWIWWPWSNHTDSAQITYAAVIRLSWARTGLRRGLFSISPCSFLLSTFLHSLVYHFIQTSNRELARRRQSSVPIRGYISVWNWDLTPSRNLSELQVQTNLKSRDCNETLHSGSRREEEAQGRNEHVFQPWAYSWQCLDCHTWTSFICNLTYPIEPHYPEDKEMNKSM